MILPCYTQPPLDQEETFLMAILKPKVDLKKEHQVIDRICKEEKFPCNEFVPMAAAAKYLEVSVRQCRHLCQSGHIGEKYGVRTWLIHRDELIQFKPEKPPLGRPIGSTKKK